MLAIAIVATLLYDPFWFVERATDIYLWKTNVHSREIVVAGNRLHYLEAKPPNGVPDRPIVLIHGLGARASDWSSLTPSLARHGYHVYAVDLLGYGQSDVPGDGDTTLQAEENAVAGFIDAIGLKQPDVAGWSMGGWVAVKYALDHPSHVRRLVLYDSAGMYIPLSYTPELFTPRDAASLNQLIFYVEPDRQFIRLPGFAIPGLLRRLRRSEPAIESSLSSMFDGREILDFRIHRLGMPVLLVWGDQDKLIPAEYGERMHQLLPQSIFLRLLGCGHLAIVECPSQGIPPTLRFLDAEPPLPPGEQAIPSGQ